MERGLQEFVSIGRVVIVLSCQIVLAMLHAIWRCWKTLRVETADESCELNVRYAIIYSTNAFPLPILRINSFSAFPKSTSSERKTFFRILAFPLSFFNVILQNAYKNRLMETWLVATKSCQNRAEFV